MTAKHLASGLDHSNCSVRILLIHPNPQSRPSTQTKGIAEKKNGGGDEERAYVLLKNILLRKFSIVHESREDGLTTRYSYIT